MECASTTNSCSTREAARRAKHEGSIVLAGRLPKLRTDQEPGASHFAPPSRGSAGAFIVSLLPRPPPCSLVMDPDDSGFTISHRSKLVAQRGPLVHEVHGRRRVVRAREETRHVGDRGLDVGRLEGGCKRRCKRGPVFLTERLYLLLNIGRFSRRRAWDSNPTKCPRKLTGFSVFSGNNDELL